MFNSWEFFIVFLTVVVIFVISLLLDYFFYLRKLKGNERRIYGNRPSLRFYVKKLIARLLIILREQKNIPVDDIDKLQIFNDRDEMVK